LTLAVQTRVISTERYEKFVKGTDAAVRSFFTPHSIVFTPTR
jgi:hypothetical protein